MRPNITLDSRTLFNHPRRKLALLYAGVIGSVLLGLGYVSHHVLEYASNRIIDRELHLLATTLTAKLERVLDKPGQLPRGDDRWLAGFCVAQRPCFADPSAAIVVPSNYALRLLTVDGRAIAALGEFPDRFPDNRDLNPSYTTHDRQGQLYHLHLAPLRTHDGDLWGYLEVGTSVQKLEDYMTSLHWLVGLGVPGMMFLVGVASWWLAGIAMRPLYQSYQAMQQFTIDAAHELKTPIATIRATIESSLSNHELTLSETRRILQTLHRQNQRLSHLTQDLLLLCRLDARSSQLAAQATHQSICLNEVIQDLEEELSPLALNAEVDFNCDSPENQACMIFGQLDHIYQLISNLITNAIKFTPAGGTVQVLLTKTHHQAILSVTDTGVGIAEADLPHVFDRFYRVGGDRSRETGGTGLGLAISWAIVQAHGGQIQVQSTLGHGTRFTVRFPLHTRIRPVGL